MKWYFMIFMLNFPREVEIEGYVLGYLGLSSMYVYVLGPNR